MKRHITICIMLFINNQNILAQIQPSIIWAKCFGGTEYDYPNSIINTSDYGYLITGDSQSDDVYVTGQHGLIPTSDIWIVKVDNNGNFQWGNCYGGTNNEYGKAHLQIFDSYYLLTGQTSSNNGDVSGNHGASDFWLVKIDSVGGLVWQKTYGGSYGDGAYSITKTFDDGFAIAGASRSDDGDVTNHHGPANVDWDVWVMKTDSVGDLAWQISLGGTSIEQARSIIQTADSCLYVACYTGSNNGDVTGLHGTFNSYDIWIVKLSPSGGIIWTKCFGGSDVENVGQLIEKSNGNIVVVGESNSIDGDVSGMHGSHDFWVFEIDSSGSLLWQKCYGGSGYDIGESLYETSDKGILISGTTRSSDMDVSGNNGYDDIWVIKIDSIGFIQWQKTLGGSVNDYGISVIEDFNKDVIVLGAVYSVDSNITLHNGILDYWIVKLADPILSTEEQFVKSERSIIISPNPFNFITTISFDNNQNNKYEIFLYDLMGKLIEHKSISANSITIDRLNKSSGLYNIVLSETGTTNIIRSKLMIY